MSFARRWLDPIRSRWFLNRTLRRRRVSARGEITVYLRLDDAYSYLAIQILHQLDEILVEGYRPLRVVVCTAPVSHYPRDLSAEDWLRYSLQDASVLAKQHRFIFEVNSHPPDGLLIEQALYILRQSPLHGSDYLHLLQNVFHMLWQRQTGKLDTLFHMAQQHTASAQSTAQTTAQSTTQKTATTGQTGCKICNQTPLVSAKIDFAGRSYRAIDDLLRLTRRLNKYGLLTNEPVFLVNHVEWREHLVSDPVTLADIQACHARLDVYFALEDPFSWLILAYLQQDMLDYYNVQLRLYVLPYQQRDQFDWPLAARLSQRVNVPFAPFCRPDQQASQIMANEILSRPTHEQLATALMLLNGVWTQGLDPSFKPHLERMIGGRAGAPLPKLGRQLDQHQQQFERLKQPDWPAMVLQIGQKSTVFSGLYRVWQIETQLAQAADESAL